MKIVVASVFESLARQGGRFPKRSLPLLAREWQNMLSLPLLEQSFDLAASTYAVRAEKWKKPVEYGAAVLVILLRS